MSSWRRFNRTSGHLLPMPFTIAVILTLVTMALVFIVQPVPPAPVESASVTLNGQALELTPEQYETLKKQLPARAEINTRPTATWATIGKAWEKGFWNFLAFGMQMVLILVLGHTLALTRPVSWIIERITNYANDTATAAAIVGFATILVALINWGLGLIFGALLARKVAERAAAKGIPMNYPLIGAAGYVGLMVWHGGLSGSAPLTVATPGHFLSGSMGLVSIQGTLFSTMNITAVIALLIILPVLLFLMGKKIPGNQLSLDPTKIKERTDGPPNGAEHLDRSPIIGIFFALLILGVSIWSATRYNGNVPLGFLSLNYVNFLLFGLAILLHGNFRDFIRAVDTATAGASGIIIQFPLYAGIMGIMVDTGLVYEFSIWIASVADTRSIPLFNFLSGAIVNIFVPSGGGQWGVQGPVIVETAYQLHAPIGKNIMAFAYGDQLTNMIQPFWVLPLLAITGLKPQQILPYTFLLMLAGLLIFASVLMIF